jgi:uncharacterized protein
MAERSTMVAVAVVAIVAIAAFFTKAPQGGMEGMIPGVNSGLPTTTSIAHDFPAADWSQTQPLVLGESTIRMPAIDNDGNGVVTYLQVEAVRGEGRPLVNINQLLFWTDTQYSIQTAKAVAENYTGMNLSNVDIVYTIGTDASIIEGPSAGAALTIATVAAIKNRTIDPKVMITGTINADGSIGQVGGIVEKAKAAKGVGATLFLVPSGQSTQTDYNRVRRCEKIGPVNYCTTEYIPTSVNVTKESGIRIMEVGDIGSALSYFLG